MMALPARSKFSRTFSPGTSAALTYLVFAMVVGLADIYYILRHYTRFPFGDHWIWLERFYRNGLPATLYAQFNEHRLVIPGLWYFLDHRYFGGTNTFLAVLQVLMQVGCIVLVVLPLWRQADIPKPVRYVFGGFVTISMLWFIQAEDFFYPYQICIVCCNLCILGTLHLFARFVERTRESQPVVWAGIAMLVCALAANFSNGHGILVWPVMLAIGLVLRLPARWLSIILIVMLCAMGIYFFHYRTPPQHASPVESLRHPILVVHYVVLMVGLPFFGAGTQDIGLFSNVARYTISIAGILLAILLLLRFARAKSVQRSRREVIYCSLMLLCLGSCSITALGRSGRFPLWQALSGRYSPVPLLFWMALAALITTYLCGWEVRGGLGRAVWCGVLVIASLATLSTQALLGPYMAGRARAQAAAAVSIIVGTPDRVRIRDEFSLFDRILFVDREATRFLGHSLFWRPEAALLGTPLLDHFQPAATNECLGAFDTVNLLPPPSKGARLLGWAWDRHRRNDVTRIWVVDEQKVIRGFGITHLPRPDVAAGYSNPALDSAGWVAYSQLPAEGSDSLSVFASLDGETSVCQIGTSRTPAP